MALPRELLRKLQDARPPDAWAAIFACAWEICSQPIPPEKAESEVAKRERAVADIDHYLATAGWDLWPAFESATKRTARTLKKWWEARAPGRAVLLLDGLSLREAPWILGQASARGFTIHSAETTGAELPADTTPFAKALGFAQRSALNNNGAGAAHSLPGAFTESTDMEWAACADLIGAEPDWVFWHHWPDHRLHAHDDPGKGIPSLTAEVVSRLSSDTFWSFAGRLAKGRRLVITSDHGYADSGSFPDSDKAQSDYLKKTFKSGRWNDSKPEAGAFVPPIDLSIPSRHGRHLFVNGRRKWKSQGGYPTLTHGGLTVLEVAVPFIEISGSL